MLIDQFLSLEAKLCFRRELGGGKAPAPPAAPPPPIIPITETGRETALAGKDYMRQQGKKRGLLSTVHAGQEGTGMGGTAYSSAFGTKSLLGSA